MDDFDKLLATMAAEGKAHAKKKKPRKKAKTAGSTTPEVSHAVNPWTEEALVLVATNLICDRCGNESMSWDQSLFVQRKNTRRLAPITQIERLDACRYESVYGALPKRVEVLVKHSIACPQCFGIGDNRAGELIGEMTPVQQQLPLEVQQEKI